MTELASGAVSTLLSLIRDEVQLLGGVQGDVLFIKEEMESINSFLLYLARTVPPSAEHDGQVRTWMNQARLLAVDCNNCIGFYLYHGIPLPKGNLLRYLMWVPWFLRKTMAQHRAAVELQGLKERAREIGKRRLRYGVLVPATGQLPSGSATTSAHVAAFAAGGDDASGEEQVAVDHSGGWATFELGSLEDYFMQKLLEWVEVMPLLPLTLGTPSMAIVAPGTRQADEACALTREVLHEYLHVHHVLLIDIPAVHDEVSPLESKHVLYYLLRELELEHARSQSQAEQQEATSGQAEYRAGQEIEHATSQSQAQQQQEATSGEDEVIEHATSQSFEFQGEYKEKKKKISSYRNHRKNMQREISHTIKRVKIPQKLESIKGEILQVIMVDQLQPYLGQFKGRNLEYRISNETLGVLLLLLKSSADAAEQDQLGKKKVRRMLTTFYNHLIKATAMKLKEYLEAESSGICLHQKQYEDILREVFPLAGDSKDPKQDKMIAMITLDEDQIKRIADRVKQDILMEVFPILMTSNSKALKAQDQVHDSSAATHATGTTLSSEDQLYIPQEVNQEKSDRVKETTIEKIKNIEQKIEMQLKIKGVLDIIEKYLKYKTVIILKVNQMLHISPWKETRRALSLLHYVAGALIITTESYHQAKEYCYPHEYISWEPIDFSLVGLYHSTMLQFTSPKMQEENYIFRKILDSCKPHEFCMKIFAHALYAKPMRSNEELYNLWRSLLEDSSKSLGSIAQKMIKFSYNDLTEEYKSCLLYLAIFPQRHIIKRSTLIGRWVVEGLITTEECTWQDSVDKAKRCFDMLIKRRLVYPTDIGTTGDVKSCMVDDLVHEFITRIAKKQFTMQKYLSHHLARHFSISNSLQLCRSDTIQDLLKSPSKSSRFVLLKVLDLEDCQCFGWKNKHYLKGICCKLLLLKYLSLRRTDITHLPNEINNLHELEVLDIRDTKVPVYATRRVRLLKLKRLLSGHNDPSNNDNVKEFPRSVKVPDNIEKMLDMEVLSNVTAPSSRDLKNIGVLCNLRKLGVVIEDNDTHLESLIVAISNMHECLKSLSITILPKAGQESTPSSGTTQNDHDLRYSPKVLESLSISGTTQNVQFLQKLLTEDGNQLTKVTLHSTKLNQGALNVLAKLPKLICVRLRSTAYTERKLTFKKDEFRNLKFFHVEGPNMTDISFEGGAAPELEKILLSFTDNLKSLSGVNGLPKLRELEFNGEPLPNGLEEDIKKHRNKPVLKHNKRQNQE